jgi:hypothetical protein
LPEWVRARGLAIFMTVYFGAHTAGSALWGQVATVWGLPLAHFIAAVGALLAIPITWRWHLQTGANFDLTPSLHWAAPVVSHEIQHDRGPVLVTVEYRIDPANRRPFLAALDHLGPRAPARRRLSLGRVRGCSRPIALRRDIFGR